MSRFYLLVGCLLAVTGSSHAQRPADTLSFVNWNLEWWGDGNTHDARAQVAHTEALMNRIGADVYALQEIVAGDSLAALAQRLKNGPWAAVVSPYASAAATPSAPAYPTAQKLALLYRTAVFRNVTARPFLKGHPYSYYDFSSGRFPFLVRGEIQAQNGAWQRLSFIVLHAKAQQDDASCQRRVNAAHTMKDSLDQRMPDEPFLVLGDYNDDLDGTICASGGTSAYKELVDDSSDAVSYRALTLPLSRAGVTSIDGYSNLIDHVIASDEAAQAYIGGSAVSLRSLVRDADPDYVRLVSDHYPIRTRYLFKDSGPASVAPEAPVGNGVQVFPNPAVNVLTVSCAAATPASCTVYNGQGQVVFSGVLASGKLSLPVSGWAGGLYLVAVGSSGAVETARFYKIP